MEKTDLFFMNEALIEAQKAFEIGEVPVGAVLVYQNQIIARSPNQVETLIDATAHAEMLCIRQGSEILHNWRLTGCTLYTTLQPCPMCAGALTASRVDRVVWGAPDLHPSNVLHTVQVTSGILADESTQLLKSFFQGRRKWKKSLTN